MKHILLALTILTAQTSFADIYKDYQEAGEKALALTQAQPDSLTSAILEINSMTELGFKIMDLYSARYTECLEQFEQLKSIKSDLKILSYSEIDKLYHDGAGLVAAPRSCYKARSLVVHPYQVAALIREGRTTSDAETIEHELNEVIERVDFIKDAIEK